MTRPQTQASLPQARDGALLKQIADFLAQLVGLVRPRRLARMSYPNEDKPEIDKKTKRRTGRMILRDKYEDIRDNLTYRMLLDHASGGVTYASTIDQAGLARAGVIDIDAGGKDALLALLSAAHRLGYNGFAVFVGGQGDHQGGHVWCFFDDRYSAADINALMRQIAIEAQVTTKEFWPQNQGIRLPFGYHQTKRTRGELLTQDGEVVDLDTNLEAGVDLVLSLPLNSAPPGTESSEPSPNTTTQYLPDSTTPLVPGHDAGKTAKANRAQNNLIARIAKRTIDRFNREHPNDISQSLQQGSNGNYFCDCGGHDSGRPNIAIWKASDGVERAQSYSTDCRMFPLFKSGKVLDPWACHVIRDYGGDQQRAIEAHAREYGYWRDVPAKYNVQQQQRMIGPDPPACLNPGQRAQRQRDADRKREARRQDAVAMLADVRVRAASDDRLSPCDQAVIQTLLTVAGTKDWCRPSKARIVELCGYSLGSVKRSLMRLESFGYFVSAGAGGQSNQTAIRTFLRGSLHTDSGPPFLRGSSAAQSELANVAAASGEGATQPMLRGSLFESCTGEMIHESHESCDLNHESLKACERGAPRAPDPLDIGEPNSLDTWAWCDAPIGADDLALLNEPSELITSVTAGSKPRVRRCGPWFYIGDGMRCGPTRRTEAEARAAWEALVNPTQPNSTLPADPGRSQRESTSDQLPPEAVLRPSFETGGASYDQAHDWTAQNGLAPSRSWCAELRPRALERWQRRPDLGGDWEIHEPLDHEQAEQHLDAGDAFDVVQPTMPLLLPPHKKPTQEQVLNPKTRERYRGALTTRTEVALASELRKHRSTLKKYAGAIWLAQIRDKLVLVETEIDRRATAQPERACPTPLVGHERGGARSQAPPAP
jgi:hypothetical protein